MVQSFVGYFLVKLICRLIARTLFWMHKTKVYILALLLNLGWSFPSLKHCLNQDKKVIILLECQYSEILNGRLKMLFYHRMPWLFRA